MTAREPVGGDGIEAVLAALDLDHQQFANEGRSSLFGDAAAAIRTLRASAPEDGLRARVAALAEEYEVLADYVDDPDSTADQRARSRAGVIAAQQLRALLADQPPTPTCRHGEIEEDGCAACAACAACDGSCGTCPYKQPPTPDPSPCEITGCWEPATRALDSGLSVCEKHDTPDEGGAS